MYYRILFNKLIKTVDSDKIEVVTGLRQIGKSLMFQKLIEHFKDIPSQYFDLEIVSQREFFKPTTEALSKILDTRRKNLLFLDEIQTLENSGIILKIIHDHFPLTKVFVTGSSSYLLLENIGDSLIGRANHHEMFPIICRELLRYDSTSQFSDSLKKNEIQETIKTSIVFGGMPEVVFENDLNTKRIYLNNYIDAFLFKDIYKYEQIRKSELLIKLLTLLANQIGGLININELSSTLGVSVNLINEYISLFEKYKIIFKLKAYTKNIKGEMMRTFKIYFTDLGIRNAIIKNFEPIELRADLGALFENYVILNEMQKIEYNSLPLEIYFWRNYNDSEVDLVELDVFTQKIKAIEIKFSKTTLPSTAFTKNYTDIIESRININFDNVWELI